MKRKLLAQIFHVTERVESLKQRQESRDQIHRNGKIFESCKKGKTVEPYEELAAVKKQEVIKSLKISCIQY